MSQAPSASETGYLRVLSRLDGTLLVIGSIIGAGVFFTPHDIARVVQSPGTMLGVWVLGGLIALTGALSYAELGGLFPRTGGVYVFLREAYGGLPAFLYGWAILLVIVPGALAIVAGFFATNLGRLAPGLAGAEIPVALSVIGLLTLVNVRGVRWGSTVQNVFTGAKLLAILLLVAGGLAYRGERVAPAPDVVVPSPSHAGIAALLFAMMPVLFSYGGWQNGTYVAGEMRRPQRDVPWAVTVGTLVVIVAYLLVNLAYLRVLDPAAIAGDRGFASAAATAALGPVGGVVVTLGILVSTFGICAAMLLTNPRVAQALGADGLFFRRFGELHQRFRTPHWAIVVLGAWSCALLLIGGAGQLLDSVVFVDWVFFAATGATVTIFRRRLPGAERPYRCPGYPWVPLLFTALAAGMAVLTLIKADATSRLLGPGILLAGVPAYLAFRASARAREGC
ncbi:MAG TPA: amino acid permease [Thermoanaerobaculia bacterium]|nr:amino acid permease [Thermoanaerobaculia bacterium]